MTIISKFLHFLQQIIKEPLTGNDVDQYVDIVTSLRGSVLSKMCDNRISSWLLIRLLSRSVMACTTSLEIEGTSVSNLNSFTFLVNVVKYMSACDDVPLSPMVHSGFPQKLNFRFFNEIHYFTVLYQSLLYNALLIVCPPQTNFEFILILITSIKTFKFLQYHCATTFFKNMT